ncbi:MAG: 23S rRNA (uracil(1939)-C(5))-methyltransferase RlmD [Magnetococcus sp. DMHC-1]
MAEIDLTVERLVAGGDGLGFHAGRAVFIPFTAPGDHVRARLTRMGKHFHRAEVATLLAPGPERIAPLCSLYGHCGGCQLQHLQPQSCQMAKQGFVVDALHRIGHIADAAALTRPLLAAPVTTGYRRRASFKVREIQGRILVGFFAPGSHHLLDLAHCPVLHPALASLLHPLRHLLGTLTMRARLPQVDVVQGDNGTALICHLLDPLSGKDRERLIQFARDLGLLQLWLQGGRKHNLLPLVTETEPLYHLDGLELRFRPGDFTQANFEQNQHLVRQAMAWAGSGSRAVDLFCGVGNLTLPLGQRFTEVLGLEGYGPAVERGLANAQANRLGHIAFRQMELHGKPPLPIPELTEADICLVNPPRTGALSVMKSLVAAQVPRVVYVACDPATFARDAAHLVHHGYRLEQVQPLDMLPLTHHVETIALFVWSGPS